MPRDFNGSSHQWVGAAGANGITFGTIAVIARTDTDGAAKFVYMNRDTAANRAGLGKEASNALSGRYSGAVIAPTITWTAADDWVLVAMAKATGTATTRFYKYVFSTDTWSIEDDDATIANANSAFTQTNIGHRANDQRFDGQIAVVGVFNYKLTDEQIALLPFTLMAWHALGPVGLWLFDQAATTMPVPDLTGGGADETTLTGTSVSGLSVPTFSYGVPILGPTKDASGAVSETPTPGGATAEGSGPTAKVAGNTGGADAAGSAPSASAAPTAGGATAAGTEPASTTTATPTPGEAIAAGQGAGVQTGTGTGGGTGEGAAPTAKVAVTPGGGIAGGTSPTDNSPVSETPTPGGAIAGGFSPTENIVPAPVAPGGAPDRVLVYDLPADTDEEEESLLTVLALTA